MFALVRHGHAGDKQQWPGDDLDRPLSARGRQQALGVLGNLGSVRPTRLISSPYRRCLQTLQPLGARTGLPIVADPALRPDADIAALDRLLHSAWADDAVLCTHGEVMRELRARWERREPALRHNGDWPAGGHTEKGAAWLVVPDGRLWTMHYFRPVHVGPVLSDPVLSDPALTETG